MAVVPYPSSSLSQTRVQQTPKTRQNRRPHDITRDGTREDDARLYRDIAARKATLEPDQQAFAQLCDRWDDLYYPSTIKYGAGADNWPEHPSARIAGRVHISINSYPVYVDVPAALQSVPPIENILPLVSDEQGRSMAAAMERVYFAWKDDVSFEELAHQACVVKGLYGRTAAKVWWDEDADSPRFTIVDQPRNLYLGWGSSDYRRLDWALYVYRMTPEAVLADWGLTCRVETDASGKRVVKVHSLPEGRGYNTHADPLAQRSGREGSVMDSTQTMVEVWDYWYREPDDESAIEEGERTTMVTRNCIYVGDYKVMDEEHSEYRGAIPYLPLFNTYLPGLPTGRSELYDIEQLIREKEQRLSEYAQMMSQTVNAQYWQLVGPEAPDVVPTGMRPQGNKVIAPGAGNRVEAIQPWMPSFQAEQYLARIDRELQDVSGLNDLLRGLAPNNVLSSSKAINALVANYETRSRMKRDLLYRWRRDIWKLAGIIWSEKQPKLRPIFEGVGRLVTDNPSLSPRDDLETATMAINLVNAKLWSLERGMDAVGVEDPESEISIVKEERTDASLFPADVQVQAALMSTMQQLQMTAQQMGQGQPQPGAEQGVTPEQAAAAFGQEQGGALGDESMQGMGAQVMPGAEATPGGPMAAGQEPMLAQTMIKEGEPSNRLMFQQELGGAEPPEEGA